MAKKKAVSDEDTKTEEVKVKKSKAIVKIIASGEVLRVFSLEVHGEDFVDMALGFVKKPDQFYNQGPLKGQPKYRVEFE